MALNWWALMSDHKIVLMSGTTVPKLAGSIAEMLNLELLDPGLVRFANGEIYCELENTVRGCDVYIIQSLKTPVNDSLMELLIMIDAVKRSSAASITAVMPHYGYSRQDRMNRPRTPITAKLVADMLTVAGATRVITMDLHAGQIQGFFDIPFDNIYASPVILKYIRESLFKENSICVSPDSGGIERVRHYAKKLGCDIGMIDKRRVAKNVAQAMNVIGNIKGKECILIDDIVDTAGSLVEAVHSLMDAGATKVVACMTHPILSHPALERIEDCKELEQVVVTDTIPLTDAAKKVSKIKIVSVASILSQAIHRTYTNQPLSCLFIETE